MTHRTVRTSIIAAGACLALAGCGRDGDMAGSTPAAVDAAPAAGTATAPAEPACGRDCLLGFVDRYVAALVANDPARAPFAADAKFTENAQVLELGDGLWNTASAGPDGYDLRVADPVTGNAAFFMLMRESDRPIWLSGRLRVDDDAITALETVVLREGRNFGNYEREAPDPVWDTVLDPSERRSRAELIDIADRYLEALDENLADYAPFTDDCNRIENGMQTTNNTSASFGGDGPNVGALGCRENINSLMWHYITDIDPRRFLAVDEARGIVFGVFMFHHDGTIEAVEIPGYGRYEYSGATRRPFTTVIPEMFKIIDGRIRQIEATMAAIPFGSDSGW